MRDQWALYDLIRSVHLARVRCLGATEIIARLPGITEDSDRNELLLRLEELELTQEQIEAVANVVQMLSAYGDTLPSRDKPRVDATIARIVKALPQDAANELVKPLLGHPRRARRDIAYKSLRHVGVTLELANELFAVFQRTGDEKMLELIARTSNVVPEVDVEFLLRNLSEDYWRVRVLEALLRHRPKRAVELANEYPKEFIWAVGRAKADTCLPLLEKIAEARRGNIDILSLYAWALGQLRASRQLERLIEQIQQTWPDDSGIL
jgi:hypothetical protein